MKVHWLHQDSQIDHDPWEELGNSEVIGDMPSCEEDGFTNDWHQRRFPIHSVPEETADDHKLQLGALITYPDGCSVSRESSRGRIASIIRADRIKPVTVVTRDEETGAPLPPPYALRDVFNTEYDKPASDRPNYLWEYQCRNVQEGDPIPRNVQGRMVVPMLRIVNWPGWQISCHVSGYVPKCVRMRDQNPQDQPFRFRVGIAHTASWANSMTELNLDGSLWDHEGYDHCEMQTIDFDLFINVLLCDQIVDMWEVYPADDDYFLGHPISHISGESGAYCMYFSNFRLWPPV